MGTYRFILAALVILSHTGFRVGDYNPGVVAVISFFILSGYVMTKLIDARYSLLSDVPLFYLDRTARLFPQFLVYSFATLIAMHLMTFSDVRLTECSARNVALNLLMIPLDFYFEIGMDKCLLIPQAWTLGLELCFYLVVPFFLLGIKSSKTRLLVCAASAVIFIAAFLGLIPTNEFGYIWLPGTFFIFAIGIATARPEKLDSMLPATAWALAIILFVTLLFDRQLFAEPYNRETVAGILIGVPAIRLLIKLPKSKLDETLGNLSYGMFLNHYLLIWWLQDGSMIRLDTWRWRFCLVGLSCVLSAVTFLGIERWFLRWRGRLRYRVTATPVVIR